MITRILRLAAAAIAFCTLFIALSYLINGLLLADEHRKYAFFRPDTDPRVFPGLMLASLLWSALISIGFACFGGVIRAKNAFVRGALYGAVVFVLFIAAQEVFYYLFIRFDISILIGALCHYALAFVLGGGVIGLIVEPRRGMDRGGAVARD